MGWVVYLRDKGGEGQRYTSSVLDTREQTIDFARAFLQAGDLEIVEMRNHDGETIDLAQLRERSDAGDADGEFARHVSVADVSEIVEHQPTDKSG